jgi:hypothetical protein
MPFQTHNPRLSDVWTEERVALLLKLDTEDQLSRAQIANELARQTGSRFSRNAIIGKLARIGVPPKTPKRAAHHKRYVKSLLTKAKLRPPPTLRKNSSRIFTLINPDPELLESRRLSLFDLTEDTCRYPTSAEGVPIEFCGHTIAQRSCCAGHYRMCYYRVSEYKRKNPFGRTFRCEAA